MTCQGRADDLNAPNADVNKGQVNENWFNRDNDNQNVRLRPAVVHMHIDKCIYVCILLCMTYSQTLRKWGNGQGFRVPKKVLEEAGFEVGQEFEFQLEKGKLVGVPKSKAKHLTLDELLEGMTPERTVEDEAWLNMKPVGNEIIDDDYSVSAK